MRIPEQMLMHLQCISFIYIGNKNKFLLYKSILLK